MIERDQAKTLQQLNQVTLHQGADYNATDQVPTRKQRQKTATSTGCQESVAGRDGALGARPEGYRPCATNRLWKVVPAGTAKCCQATTLFYFLAGRKTMGVVSTSHSFACALVIESFCNHCAANHNILEYRYPYECGTTHLSGQRKDQRAPKEWNLDSETPVILCGHASMLRVGQRRGLK
jgi:hypothetical protein